MYEVRIPDECRDVGEVRVHHWFYEEGDEVEEHTDLVEITTPDGTVIIPSPGSGVLEEVYGELGEPVSVQDVLAIIVDKNAPQTSREEESE